MDLNASNNRGRGRIETPPVPPSCRPLASLALFLLLSSASLPIAAQLSLARPSQLSQPVEYARFGDTLAVGDVNGDGLDDLAIGMPTRDGNAGEAQAGGVMIALGGNGGWETRTIVGCGGHPVEGGLEMGRALAIGHFDLDAYADIVIGLPGATIGGQIQAGAVCVVRGAPTLAQIEPSTALMLSRGELHGVSQAHDRFGRSLAIGDLDGDGHVDLAIGAPNEDVWLDWVLYDNAGAAHVVFGTETGPDPTSAVRMTLDDHPFVPIANSLNYGFVLAIGRVAGENGQGLYAGLPEAAVGGAHSAGVVFATIFEGRTPGSQVVLRQGLAGTSGTPNAGERFGQSLVLADFNGDDIEDLAVGVPFEDGLGVDDGGAVNILLGGEVAIHSGPDQMLFEGLIDPATFDGELFGLSLAAGDFDRDGFDDLAVAAPADETLGVDAAGEVTIFYGSMNGLSIDGHQVASMLFFGGLQPDNYFGTALATGHFFEAHGGADLAVGVPQRVTQGGSENGLVQVIQSAALFADGFESGSTATWSQQVN